MQCGGAKPLHFSLQGRKSNKVARDKLVEFVA
jgi:hypothetical protein